MFRASTSNSWEVALQPLVTTARTVKAGAVLSGQIFACPSDYWDRSRYFPGFFLASLHVSRYDSLKPDRRLSTDYKQKGPPGYFQPGPYNFFGSSPVEAEHRTVTSLPFHPHRKCYTELRFFSFGRALIGLIQLL